MARSFDTVIVQALMADETDEAFFILLTVKHSGFGNVRIVNNMDNITSNGDTFTAFPFSIILPADTDDAQPSFKVSLSNANLFLVEEFRSIAGGSERVLADVSVIAASDPDTIMAAWTDFELTDMVYDADRMSFSLSIDWFMSEAFPKHSFTPGLFPGIF